jgi:CHAD domain-containing protein
MGEIHQAQHGETCEARFRSVALAAVEAFDAALETFLTSEDPQGPHKARVSLRRLTTALDAFRPILRRKAAELWRARAKKIFAALGRVRDSDVHLADRQARPGDKARRERNRLLRQKTRKAMRKRQVAEFAPGLRTAVADDGAMFRRSARARDLRAAPVAGFAAGALDEAWQRCLGHGRSVRAMTDEERHEFRKDMKTLRYQSEFFADLFPGLGNPPFAEDLRAIQDALGTLNDFAVALEIEGRKSPARPPKRVAEAMEEAERLWDRLSGLPLPWAGQATRRP